CVCCHCGGAGSRSRTRPSLSSGSRIHSFCDPNSCADCIRLRLLLVGLGGTAVFSQIHGSAAERHGRSEAGLAGRVDVPHHLPLSLAQALVLADEERQLPALARLSRDPRDCGAVRDRLPLLVQVWWIRRDGVLDHVCRIGERNHWTVSLRTDSTEPESRGDDPEGIAGLSPETVGSADAAETGVGA